MKTDTYIHTFSATLTSIVMILLVSCLNASCGYDEETETDVQAVDIVDETEEIEADEITVIMCQFDDENNVLRELEFIYDTNLIYFIACYNFESCDSKRLFSDEAIESYRQEVCPNES